MRLRVSGKKCHHPAVGEYLGGHSNLLTSVCPQEWAVLGTVQPGKVSRVPGEVPGGDPRSHERQRAGRAGLVSLEGQEDGREENESWV